MTREEKKESWEGPQWEYRFVVGDNLPQSAFKGLGSTGWELCAATPWQQEGRVVTRWIFKRPKL